LRFIDLGTYGRREEKWGKYNLFPFKRWGNTLYTNMKKNYLFKKKNSCACSLVPVGPFNITENKDDDSGT